MLIKEDVRMPVVEVAAGQVWITTVTVQIMRGVGQGKTKKVQADTLFCPGAVHSSLFPVPTAICTFVVFACLVKMEFSVTNSPFKGL